MTLSWWQKIESSLWVKLTIFLLTMLMIVIIFGRAISFYDPSDPLPELKIVDVEKRKELGTFVAKINTGIFIKSFPVFDVAKNNFTTDLIIWFEYDPDRVMLETISQFSFDNGEILRKSPPDIRFAKEEEGKILVKYEVRVSFRSNLSYKRYPLDDHRLSLVLTNNAVTAAEVYFLVETTSFRIDPSLFIADWKIADLSTDAGFLEVGLEEKSSSDIVSAPKARFTMRVEKKGIKDTFIIFLPLYVATFTGMYTFLTSLHNAQSRYIIASSIVPALLGYRFVIQNLLPVVAYFTTTDNIYLLLLLLGFFIFIFQSVLMRRVTPALAGADKAPEARIIAYYYFERVNFWAFLCVTFILLAGSYYFALR